MISEPVHSPAKIVTVHCTIGCVDGKAPSEADAAGMLRQIELYAVRKGYKGVIETRQYWAPAPTAAWARGVTKDYWHFAVYRDYNAP